MTTLGCHRCLLLTICICHCKLRCFTRLPSWCASVSLSCCHGCGEAAARWLWASVLLCFWCAASVALVLCLLIAVRPTLGIYQNSGVNKILYSLWLTVNNKLMCERWLLWLCCYTLRITACLTKAFTDVHKRHFVMYRLITVLGVGWSSGTYYNSCAEGRFSSVASLNTVW